MKHHDLEFFNCLCTEPLELGKVEVKSVIILGKKQTDGRPHPIKVILVNPCDKKKIMISLKKVRDAGEIF